MYHIYFALINQTIKYGTYHDLLNVSYVKYVKAVVILLERRMLLGSCAQFEVKNRYKSDLIRRWNV